jgi:hypothetical protein
VQVTSIILSYDGKGQPMYHALGGRYTKHGARVWPEYIEQLKIDPAKLQPGPNPWVAKVKVQPAKDGRAPKVIGMA